MKITKSYLKQIIKEELTKADLEAQRRNLAGMSSDPNDQRLYNDIEQDLELFTRGGQPLSTSAKADLMSKVKGIKNTELRVRSGRKIDPNYAG
jgi:hypothetical protein